MAIEPTIVWKHLSTGVILISIILSLNREGNEAVFYF